jgi:hypothetical protein
LRDAHDRRLGGATRATRATRASASRQLKQRAMARPPYRPLATPRLLPMMPCSI